jgi:hypothetical protein
VILAVKNDLSSDTPENVEDDINQEDLVRTCPNCGQKMIDQKCKLICTCGYYASCADYY